MNVEFDEELVPCFTSNLGKRDPCSQLLEISVCSSRQLENNVNHKFCPKKPLTQSIKYVDYSEFNNLDAFYKMSHGNIYIRDLKNFCSVIWKI